MVVDGRTNQKRGEKVRNSFVKAPIECVARKPPRRSSIS